MLVYVSAKNEKKAAQAQLKNNLESVLENEGILNIGFPGGNVNSRVFAFGHDQLWYTFRRLSSREVAVPRYWNAFGTFYANHGQALTINVEINIASDTNTKQVAGFFAKDSETGAIFLMHTGKIGGGRPGVGKGAFLVQSKATLISVDVENGLARNGILIGRLDDPYLSGHIWRFVQSVKRFKVAAVNGELETQEFQDAVKDFEHYNPEFSGKKKGSRKHTLEYDSHHGNVVDTLHKERSARATKGEIISNDGFVDLKVKINGYATEIYEVKTSLQRQILYTAIGQLLTHSITAAKSRPITKFLVVPDYEQLPSDLAKAIDMLGIQIRKFKLVGTPKNRTIELLSI
jgi:hypothetical protein